MEHDIDLPSPQSESSHAFLARIVRPDLCSRHQSKAIANFASDLLGNTYCLCSTMPAIILDFDIPCRAQVRLDCEDVHSLRTIAYAPKLILVKAPFIQLRDLPSSGKLERQIPLDNRRHQAASGSR